MAETTHADVAVKKVWWIAGIVGSAIVVVIPAARVVITRDEVDREIERVHNQLDKQNEVLTAGVRASVTKEEFRVSIAALEQRITQYHTDVESTARIRMQKSRSAARDVKEVAETVEELRSEIERLSQCTANY